MSASKAQIGTFGEAIIAAGVTPAQRLEATARRVMRAQPPHKRVDALLRILSTDNLLMIELTKPVQRLCAEDYFSSLAQADEGEGPASTAERAKEPPPSPNQSPKGGDAGHRSVAEQAMGDVPASQHSAPAAEREGHEPAAKQPMEGSPSRFVASIQSITMARDKDGKYVESPIPVKPSEPWRRAPNPPRVSAEIVGSVRRIVADCIMDTMMIGETPLRDATPTMCRNFVKKHRRNALFVERLVVGVPEDRRIGDFVKDAEANAIYQTVTTEVFHAV